MRIDVLFGPATSAPAAVTGRVVAVIDVLRASTTIAAALANGARNVVPLESADEVITRARNFERSQVRLAGEHKMLPISGFDFGNSPLEVSRDSVEGTTVLMTTTNGTIALAGIQGARDVAVASYVNFSAVSALLRAALRGGTAVTIICAGRDRLFSLEDAACAGRYVRDLAEHLPDAELSDAARVCMMLEARYGDDLAKLFADSELGRALAAAVFEKDLEICATIDAFPVVPLYQDRQITALGPRLER
jgi:2-phosphosulfolactate phosphatase